MANPRKFSEKIALHNQKQAEETAAFEEIMREVMGATRLPQQGPSKSSNTTSAEIAAAAYNNQQQQQQQLQHIATPTFSATRAGSLPNVNQISQTQHSPSSPTHQSNNGGKKATTTSGGGGGGIDLQSALTNLEEIKNGCLDRSGSLRVENRSRTVSPSGNRSPLRHHGSNQNLAAASASGPPYNSSVAASFSSSASHHHHKRSQSPYSINNNAYLSPPQPEGHWRRTASDSALHQSALLSAATNHHHHAHHLNHHHQGLDGFNQLIADSDFGTGQNTVAANIATVRRSPVPQDSSNINLGQFGLDGCSNDTTSSSLWEAAIKSGSLSSNPNDKFLLSASLPADHHLRPRSCEVPGINIFPSADETIGSDGNGVSHHNIPISSNTGSLPDLTNLHFPVPLHSPIDSEDQSGGGDGANGMQQQNQIMQQQQGQPSSPYSNGSDSPYSPGSSANSNLSPPPPCNMMGSYQQAGSPGQQSPRRQASPGPSPSPTSSRRRMHHNVNNLVLGNPRHQQQSTVVTHQAQSQVCFSNNSNNNHRPAAAPQQHTPQMSSHPPPLASPQPAPLQPSPHHIPSRSSSYLNEQSHSSSQPYTRYKSPPRITVEGLAMDTSALTLNGNSGQMPYTTNGNGVVSGSSSAGSTPFVQHQQQFHFTNAQANFQNFTSMGMHRSTTPTEASCSAPTSPASQQISPSNSPELPINSTNAGGQSPVTTVAGQVFGQSVGSPYSNSYSNQQANILQHQLEQFRMTNESDNNGYMMTCNSDLSQSMSQANGQNANVFYLDSLESSSMANVSLTQYNTCADPSAVISPQQSSQQSNSTVELSSSSSGHQLPFTADSLYYSSSPLNSGGLVNSPTLVMNAMNNLYGNSQQPGQQQLTNSSHCTTPQTPSSIPDIILTGPNLDELQSADFVKDLNQSMAVNMNTSFDSSDIFCSASDELRSTGGSFDSFDLDNLPLLTDIDSSNSNQQ